MTPTDTPLAYNVAALQDAGHNVHIRGWTPNYRYALIVTPTDVTVASRHTVNGLGRWECSPQHLAHCPDVYAARFPNHHT